MPEMIDYNAFIKIKVPKSLQFLKPYECKEYIRLGRNSDGGYIVPSFIVDMTDNLLSLGLWYEWSFDSHFQKLRPGLTIHGYDYTVSVWSMSRIVLSYLKTCIKRPGMKNAELFYYYLLLLKKYLWFWVIRNRHYRQRINAPIERSYDVSLDQAIRRIQNNHSKGLFIKMDIEGSEYTTIDSLVDHAAMVTGMVIEFHDINTNRQGFISAVKRLQREFSIVHLHGNNLGGYDKADFLDVLEISWVRKDLLPSANDRKKVYLPGLDAPNGNRAPDYLIEF